MIDDPETRRQKMIQHALKNQMNLRETALARARSFLEVIRKGESRIYWNQLDTALRMGYSFDDLGFESGEQLRVFLKRAQTGQLISITEVIDVHMTQLLKMVENLEQRPQEIFHLIEYARVHTYNLQPLITEEAMRRVLRRACFRTLAHHTEPEALLNELELVRKHIKFLTEYFKECYCPQGLLDHCKVFELYYLRDTYLTVLPLITRAADHGWKASFHEYLQIFASLDTPQDTYEAMKTRYKHGRATRLYNHLRRLYIYGSLPDEPTLPHSDDQLDTYMFSHPETILIEFNEIRSLTECTDDEAFRFSRYLYSAAALHLSRNAEYSEHEELQRKVALYITRALA